MKQNETKTSSEAAILSAAEWARLCGGSRRVSSADLDEQIGLLLWWLQGTLSRQQQREVYQRLEVLLSRKYAEGMQ